jgi:uncharacterized protein with PIN domain
MALYGIDRKTCSRWLKEGLPVMEKDVTPLLVMGSDLKEFIKKKNMKNKVSLEKDQFYCMKCHKPVRAKVNSEVTMKTGKRIGKAGIEQLNRIGICETCGTPLNRFLGVYQGD